MRSKTELKNAVDQLEENNVVVAGVAVEQKAIRAIIDEGDEEAKDAIDQTALDHIADVVHEDTEGGHEVYQLINADDEDLGF